MNHKPINVLQFITPVGFYGAERWVLALINNSDPGLVRHDLAVTDEPEEQDLEILNQFSKEAGKKHRIVMTSKFDLSVIHKLIGIIKTRNIDIIHTHGYKSDILGLLAAKITGIKAVSTPHGFGLPENFKLRIFVKFGIFSLRFFDQVVPLSKQLYSEVKHSGVSEIKISYIRNGVDLSEVDHYREQKNKKLNEVKRIGFIGQMIPRKNIKDILDIFEEVKKKLPNTILQLLGDGESRVEMEVYSKELSSVNSIQFLGFCHDRMEYLKQFDLFVMTSKDEGVPRCLMEALGMEIPVAAYNIKGIDQLVEHEKTGLLAEFGDIRTLSDYWIKLLNDEEYAKAIAKSGREFVNKKFSGKRMAKEYLILFIGLLKE